MAIKGPNGFISHCLDCGLEHSPEWNKKRCKECRGYLTPRRCTRCDEVKDTKEGFFSVYKGTEYTPECKTCRVNRKREYRNLRVVESLYVFEGYADKRMVALEEEEKRHRAFVDAIKDKPVMSEKEWQDTCLFFGGCVLCGAEHIEARIPWLIPSEGGHYTKYNMLPMCGTCSKSIDTKHHAFRWLWATQKVTPKLKSKIIQFFAEVMDEQKS